MNALFVGGPLHWKWIEVCSWQRVYHCLRGAQLEGRYRRKTLFTSNGRAVRYFAWHSLSERESILLLLDLGTGKLSR
jgi:hypothetical protein